MSSIIVFYKQIAKEKKKSSLVHSTALYYDRVLTAGTHHSLSCQRAPGCAWPDCRLHIPLVVFVVLISMPIIYESATGYGRTEGSTGVDWRLMQAQLSDSGADVSSQEI